MFDDRKQRIPIRPHHSLVEVVGSADSYIVRRFRQRINEERTNDERYLTGSILTPRPTD